MEKNRFKPLLVQVGLVFLAAVLFSLSHPNLIFKHGLPFIAWFAYIPVLLLIKNSNFLSCIGWGAIYGFLSYSLFNYWLGTFHPMAGLIVYSIYIVYLAAVFLFFKLADILYPKKAYIVQWIIWLSYEYLRTKGYLGYPYGITGYSQWQITPLIQIASLTGVWGVSALVSFPSFYLAGTVNNMELTSALKSQAGIRELAGAFVKAAVKKADLIPAIIWVTALITSVTFGFINMKDFSSYPSVKIALIQHNTDPWEATKAPTTWQRLEAYQKDLEILTRLSDEALAAHPKPDLVVWPETAFVPRIYWHSTYRDDQDSWNIVRHLLEYLSAKDVPFLIGNDDARKDTAKNPNEHEGYRIDYNAAILFEKGKISGIYRKLHLVPFTEHFPYRKYLPFIYDALRNADTHFWEKGEEVTVFSGPGFTFSSPICFEDTFGYLSRNFILKGADVLVNITNDAWANSLPSQNQHLSMAVFRTVENHRPMVRSTVSGQTCAIDPTGKIILEAAPFTKTWITAYVPLVKKKTLYTLYGDYLGLFFSLTAVILLLYKASWYTIRKQKRG